MVAECKEFRKIKMEDNRYLSHRTEEFIKKVERHGQEMSTTAKDDVEKQRAPPLKFPLPTPISPIHSSWANTPHTKVEDQQPDIPDWRTSSEF